MKYLTWCLFAYVILSDNYRQTSAKTRKNEKAFSSLSDVLNAFKKGNSNHCKNESPECDEDNYEHDKGLSENQDPVSVKSSVKAYLKGIFNQKYDSEKAVHLKGVNIFSLTSRRNQSDNNNEMILQLRSWPPKKKSPKNSQETDNSANSISSLVKAKLMDLLNVNASEKYLLTSTGINILTTSRRNQSDNNNEMISQLRSWPPKKKSPKNSQETDNSANSISSLVKAKLMDLFNVNASEKYSLTSTGINIVIIDPQVAEQLSKENKRRRNNADKIIILKQRNPMRSNNHSPRRSVLGPREVLLGVPTRPEHLPKALPILPGHTLLRPSRGMLKSAVKYPLRDMAGTEVYGNLANIGISWCKSCDRVRYTDFRKTNKNFLRKLQDSIQHSKNNGQSRPLIIIEIDPSELINIKEELKKREIEKQVLGRLEENSASEILDDLDSLFTRDNNPLDLRRKRKSKSKFRDRSKYYLRKEGSGSVSSEDSSKDNEKNPGNPYTIHKDKYKQNWMWNHQMDGVHMNVNPYAPVLNQLGPSGSELFFARKWWYFNQDDYKPMGRKR